jgi:hypothetical protein
MFAPGASEKSSCTVLLYPLVSGPETCNILHRVDVFYRRDEYIAMDRGVGTCLVTRFG